MVSGVLRLASTAGSIEFFLFVSAACLVPPSGFGDLIAERSSNMLSREAAFPLFGLRTASDSPTGSSKSATTSVTPFVRTSLSALLVAVGYYAGSELGFFLKPAHTPIATFWPPSAILLAAFLLAPTQMWWVFLLAVLPAHLLVQLQGGTTLLTALGWFIANTCGPLLGAACIRRFKKENTLFDSLQGIIVFLTFGVFLPSLVKSFLNALITLQVGRESNYWMLWTTRLSSNIIAGLILIPTIVIFGRKGISWFRGAKSRYLEAGVLALSVVVVSLLVFNRENAASSVPTFIYALLPFLVWAALRFGSGGLSVSMLGVALISIWNAMHIGGPFGTSSMVQDMLVQRILSLHGLLMVLGLPLMLTAALVAERRRDQETLQNTCRNLVYMEEQERHRIARELHGDIAGRLTLAGFSLDELRADSNASARPLNRLYGQISGAFKAVLHLSHKIYPFGVEYLGLAPALIKLCRDTGAESGMTIKSSVEDVPLHLPLDVSLRVFRVAQLALENIQERQAKSAALDLRMSGGRVFLRIADDGIGIGGPQPGDGKGLDYMREQMLALGGTLKITSAPHRGTVVEASVPLIIGCS